MDYYLINKGEPEAQLLLGTDNGFGSFWPGQGLTALMNMSIKNPEELHNMQIKNDKNNTLTISQFLDAISKLKIKSH